MKHQMPPRQGNQLAHSLNTVPRVNILGVGVTPSNFPEVIATLRKWREEDRREFVCCAAVHSLVEAARGPLLHGRAGRNRASLPHYHDPRGSSDPASFPCSVRRRPPAPTGKRSSGSKQCIIWRWSSNRRPDGTGALVALLSIGASMRSINLRQTWVVPAISSAVNTTRTNT